MLVAAAGYFFLLCGYYMLRPLREALALEVGVQYNSILFSAVLVCSAILLPLYWWLVGRTPRGQLLWWVCTPFVIVLVTSLIVLPWRHTPSAKLIFGIGELPSAA